MASRFLSVLAVTLLVFSISGFFLGPTAIHAAYRTTTSAATIQKQRAEYHRLAEAELELTGTQQATNQITRGKLYLWFHARGLTIDEGDEELALWYPWTELFAYWRG